MRTLTRSSNDQKSLRALSAVILHFAWTCYLLCTGRTVLVSVGGPCAIALAVLLGGQSGATSWWLFDRRASRFPTKYSWAGSLRAGVATAVVTAIVLDATFTEKLRIWDIQIIYMLFLYGAARTGCWQTKCCGWRRESLPTRMLHVPLQLIEATSTVVLGTLAVISIDMLSTPAGVTGGVALVGHLLLRQTAEALRTGFRLDATDRL